MPCRVPVRRIIYELLGEALERRREPTREPPASAEPQEQRVKRAGGIDRRA